MVSLNQLHTVQNSLHTQRSNYNFGSSGWISTCEGSIWGSFSRQQGPKQDRHQNPTLGTQEASKGLKITNFHGFQSAIPSWKAFLGGSGWILNSKAYIHYRPWLLCPDETFMGGPWWILASKAIKRCFKDSSGHNSQGP